MTRAKVAVLFMLAATAVAAAACGEDTAGPAAGEGTVLVSVTPQGGATGVDPNAPVVVEFSHPLHRGMEAYVALHEGDVNGPVVAGTWTWSEDGTRLTFTPAAPLKPQTQYALHVGGGMRDHRGGLVDVEHHGQQMGGHRVTDGMMQGANQPGMHGQNGMGMHGQSGAGMHSRRQGASGSGWCGANGFHGMVFYFMTA